MLKNSIRNKKSFEIAVDYLNFSSRPILAQVLAASSSSCLYSFIQNTSILTKSCHFCWPLLVHSVFIKNVLISNACTDLEEKTLWTFRTNSTIFESCDLIFNRFLFFRYSSLEASQLSRYLKIGITLIHHGPEISALCLPSQRYFLFYLVWRTIFCKKRKEV